MHSVSKIFLEEIDFSLEYGSEIVKEKFSQLIMIR